MRDEHDFSEARPLGGMRDVASSERRDRQIDGPVRGPGHGHDPAVALAEALEVAAARLRVAATAHGAGRDSAVQAAIGDAERAIDAFDRA